ncbi:AIG2 family protein [Apiospora marii]|uniref:gamma-glutamylcyclotransferase n=1 Tax=Apiospora marii TaxID=335849 RepID=A0ABR1REH9_9PEZI
MDQIQDTKLTLYFAYGSNLSSTQMKARCPTAVPVGLGYLPDWTWLINKRGYANIVQNPADDQANSKPSADVTANTHDHHSVPKDSSAPGVYGVVYTLQPADEAELDVCEGVPTAYQKATLNVAVLDGTHGLPLPDTNENQWPTLVYVDHHRVEADRPKDEYVRRMNRGIDEARRDWGLPEWYIEKVMRPFIRSETS